MTYCSGHARVIWYSGFFLPSRVTCGKFITKLSMSRAIPKAVFCLAGRDVLCLAGR